MRLAALSPAVAALSAVGAGVCAFTQPRSATRSVHPQLHARPVSNADYDLSGMLTDYSGVKAATKTAEKVAEVAAPVVSAPPPVPVPVPVAAPVVDVSDVAESSMEALSKAATAAQDAADQAAAAAAAVATKGAAATKAAAAAGVAGGIPLKPLVGGVFVQVDQSKVQADAAVDSAARAQAGWATLQANFMRGVDSITGGIQESTGGARGGLDVPDLQLGAPLTVSPAVGDFVASLHLQEYGAWYAAGVLAILASQQRSAGKKEASASFQTELADAKTKADEAASAAGAAAAGAQTAKKLAMKMEKDLQKDGGQALLESSRNKMVKMEKDLMEKEMRSLKAEISSLKSQLTKADGSTKTTSAKTTAAKTEIEEEYPTKVVVDTGADEDGRIVELLKEIDEENKVKKAVTLERRREEEAKFVASQKGKEAAPAKAVKAAPKKKAAAKKGAAKAKAAPKKKAAPKAVAVKAVAVKTVAKKAPAAVPTAASDDWASLAESTLKRKTVAQLTEYLTGKGVSVTDGSGKSLKKSELLDAVKSL